MFGKAGIRIAHKDFAFETQNLEIAINFLVTIKESKETLKDLTNRFLEFVCSENTGTTFWLDSLEFTLTKEEDNTPELARLA
jgi:hypothetical protein